MRHFTLHHILIVELKSNNIFQESFMRVLIVKVTAERKEKKIKVNITDEI